MLSRGDLRLSIEILNRHALSPHRSPLVHRRQKSRRVHRRPVAKNAVGHCDVRRQIVALTTQPVRNPRPDTGMPQQTCPGMHHDHRRAVNEQLVMHRSNDGEAIGMPAEPRKHRRNPLPALAVPAKCKLRCHDLRIGRVDLSQVKVAQTFRQQLTVVFPEHRFFVERLQVRWSTLHKEEDDVLCRAWQMRRPRCEWVPHA